VPLPSGEPELGDEPAQLRRLADATEARLRRAQEETEQATQALKQVQEVLVEQCRLAEQEKVSLQTKFEEEKAQIQQEKEQLLAEQLEVKEAVNRALRSVTGLEPKAEDRVEHQVEQLVEAIQQLQQRIADLELRTVPDTPQDVRDQREATARSTVERIKALAMECKQLSDRSAQTYEKLTENPELKALESQLQEAKQQAETIQAQLKPLSVVERMKRSQEQCTAQQQVHTIQSRVMEVTQRLQPIQDEACQLFTEIEGRGAELEQVVTAAEQRLEGPVNEAVIQEFVEQEAMAQQQVEAARAKLEDFEAELPRSE
jgi:chromosome segregation ATPase